jgi:hypothetical protein
MKTNKIEIGMRVMGQNYEGGDISNLSCLNGMCGTVVSVDGGEIGVEFDKTFMEGHTCEGKSKDLHGRYFYMRHIENDEMVHLKIIPLQNMLKEMLE